MNKFAKITLWIFSLSMVAFAVLGLASFVGGETSIHASADSEMYGFVRTVPNIVGLQELDK